GYLKEEWQGWLNQAVSPPIDWRLCLKWRPDKYRLAALPAYYYNG
ncbi:unnamed protein product, partial [marine sediment metagenome]